MRRWSHNRFFGLLLGVLLTVGMSLNVFQSGKMTAMAAEMSEMVAPSHADCAHCLDGNHGGMNSAACASICAATSYALLPTFFIASIIVAASAVPSGRARVIVNRTFPPEPPPPRIGDRG